ncbi:WSC domain-containing protein [Colletotrichum fructicola]|nr:WSC domain-containing protein [Colletotrichum fructicola]
MASYEHTTHAEPAYVENAYIENGLHPVHHSDKIVGGPIDHQYDGQYYGGYTQISAATTLKAEKRICGARKPVFVLWCIIGFMAAMLVMVAGVFGAMIANQDAKIQNLQQTNGGTRTASASAAATTWVEISDWEYVGCYRDNDQRTMRDAYQNYTTSQTNRQCKAFCEKDYDYFGTETGGECYCSSTAPSEDALSPAWNCNAPCRGSSDGEICGGGWFLSMWKKTKKT